MVLLESHGQVEHILEERRMKIEKHENENFPIFLQNRCSMQNLITKILILSDPENKNFFDFLLKKGILKVYFKLPSGFLYINSRKDSVGIGTFAVKKIGE